MKSGRHARILELISEQSIETKTIFLIALSVTVTRLRRRQFQEI